MYIRSSWRGEGVALWQCEGAKKCASGASRYVRSYRKLLFMRSCLTEEVQLSQAEQISLCRARRKSGQ